MPRGISEGFLAALQANILRAAILFESTFASGPVYLWTGLGQLSFGGNTYTGLGSLASVSPIEEGGTVEARGITVGLSGVDPQLLPLVLNEFQLGQPVLLRLALFDEAGALIDAVISWAGRMDQPSIDVDGQTASIAINCENRLVDMNVAVDRRYTNEDQQLDWPGDRGLEFVSGIQDITIYWGRTPNQANNL